MQIAELAAKDAEVAVGADAKSVAYRLLLGKACEEQERYRDARANYVEGLAIDPTNEDLAVSLKRVDDLLPATTAGEETKTFLTIDDLECSVCMKLMYAPVSTSCGHSFCKDCLLRSLDHSNRCPQCRTVLFITASSLATNVTLQNVICKAFPEEVARRKAEHTPLPSQDNKANIPLFVMDSILPSQRMALNIFEPRYRLLIRRSMAGSRTFGMIALNRERTGVAAIGTEVQIKECNVCPDGRFEIEIQGCRRFQVQETCDQDGYRLARAEYLEDEAVEEEEELKALESVADQVADRVGQILNAFSSKRGLLLAITRCTGEKPTKEGPGGGGGGGGGGRGRGDKRMEYAERVSWWACAILDSLSALDSHALLEGKSTKARLDRLLEVATPNSRSMFSGLFG